MSLIFATQLTAVATAVLAAFAIVTAWYAPKAFVKQSKEVSDQASTLEIQSGRLAGQCGNPARWDLRGGPPARAVPTATLSNYRIAAPAPGENNPAGVQAGMAGRWQRSRRNIRMQNMHPRFVPNESDLHPLRRSANWSEADLLEQLQALVPLVAARRSGRVAPGAY
jgi:hypothetical protein